MATFEPIVLTARRDAGTGLHLVTITPSHALAQRYTAPGQYVEIRTDAGSGYFVLAGEVGAPSWELLVRNNGEASAVLATAPEGTVLAVQGPLGKGFPLEHANGRALIVAVAGSALAISRPILRERVARRNAALTSVYIGIRSVRDVPLLPEVAGWGHAGVRLVLCLSREEPDDPAVLPEASRAPGYVQRVLAREIQDGRVAGDIVFVAGPSKMIDDVRALRASLSPTLEVFANV